MVVVKWSISQPWKIEIRSVSKIFGLFKSHFLEPLISSHALFQRYLGNNNLKEAWTIKSFINQILMFRAIKSRHRQAERHHWQVRKQRKDKLNIYILNKLAISGLLNQSNNPSSDLHQIWRIVWLRAGTNVFLSLLHQLFECSPDNNKLVYSSLGEWL